MNNAQFRKDFRKLHIHKKNEIYLFQYMREMTFIIGEDQTYHFHLRKNACACFLCFSPSIKLPPCTLLATQSIFFAFSSKVSRMA